MVVGAAGGGWRIADTDFLSVWWVRGGLWTLPSAAAPAGGAPAARMACGGPPRPPPLFITIAGRFPYRALGDGVALATPYAVSQYDGGYPAPATVRGRALFIRAARVSAPTAALGVNVAEPVTDTVAVPDNVTVGDGDVDELPDDDGVVDTDGVGD